MPVSLALRWRGGNASLARMITLRTPLPGNGLGDRFQAAATLYPKKTAMICGDEAVTYEELDGTVTRVKHSVSSDLPPSFTAVRKI